MKLVVGKDVEGKWEIERSPFFVYCYFASMGLKEEQSELIGRVENDPILQPGFRGKKLRILIIRTCIGVLLLYLLRNHQWFDWFLWALIVLTAFSLLQIVLWPYILRRKVHLLHQELEKTEKVIEKYDSENPDD